MGYSYRCLRLLLWSVCPALSIVQRCARVFQFISHASLSSCCSYHFTYALMLSYLEENFESAWLSTMRGLCFEFTTDWADNTAVTTCELTVNVYSGHATTYGIAYFRLSWNIWSLPTCNRILDVVKMNKQITVEINAIFVSKSLYWTVDMLNRTSGCV